MRYASDVIPAERRAPPRVLAALRRVDPTADLLYLGEGEWWLGSMKPNQHRRRIGENIKRIELAKPHPSWAQLRYAEAAMLGFTFIATVYGEPNGQTVDQFRESDWVYRHDRARLEEAIFAEPERMRMHNVHSYLKSRAAADYRAHVGRLRVPGRRTLHSPTLN